uniref:Putative bag family molecular chaperone regulator 2 n=2 Tax=Triatoma infestans TaxID=30076 RepID=A0A023F9S6_TRIIF
MDCDGVPLIDDSADGVERPPKDRLLSLLDQVEAHVERLRRETLLLEERRDSLFTTLDTIRNSELFNELQETDKEDIQKYLERVTTRCMTVEILVRTDRDEQQEEALFQVNRFIDGLVVSFKTDPTNTRSKCRSFIAACSSQPEVPCDKAFESALLGCALDDQKKIKKRLHGLYTYIDQCAVVAQEIEE